MIAPYYFRKSIDYGFKVTTSYASIINPFLLSSYSFENYKKLNTKKPNEKIYVKQSYMILTWFYYLNIVQNKKIKNKKFGKFKLFIAPKKVRKFTITKAPIAHKTRSKEQIMFYFFQFRTSIKVINKIYFKKYAFYKSLDHKLLATLTAHGSTGFAETNLLFVKRSFTSIVSIDSNFFNYNNFHNNLKKN